jgi:tousled-like kinase
LQSPISTSKTTTGTTDAAVGKSATAATTPTPTTNSNMMNSRSRSPNRSSFVGISGDHSRDRSNGGSSISNKKPRILIPPANNKRIHDFFTKIQQNGGDDGANNNNTNNGRNAATTTAAANVNDNGTTTNTPRNNNNITDGTNAATGNMTSSSTKTVHLSSTSTIDTATTAAAAAIAEQWEAKYVRLQQQLQDRDEQLKAVTGNKTILHTALQQALTKTRNELNELQESTAIDRSNINSVLEDTMRWKFLKTSKDLRVSLSQDGNRLGKIVSTRAGMRVIDSWEEGYASKDWQSRKEEWKLKHRTLLDRQEKLKIRLKQQNLSQNQNQNQNEQQQQQPDNDNNDNTNGVDPSPIMSQLEIQEAKESIQMHLETLRREEKELLTEEQTLNDEKGAHIRALKRVASEDASRFRVRPKLHNRYVLDCLLGKGGFSEVWKGYDLQELREVAVKIHQLDPRWPDSKKENYTKHVSREYEIHRNVRHTRIVSLYDVFEIDNNSFATVLECCKGTDLDTLLKRKKRLPERQARAILLQILTGMQYLSQPSGSRQGIIHYDLKPGNILFDEFGDAKITDFGLSKIVDTPDPAESMELTSQGAGTYWYLPPECFVTGEQVRISNKVDVWSIGVIFYQMIYGKRPFGEGKSQDKLLADHTMLNAQEVHLPERPDVSDSGKEFVKQCLMYDQAFRPTIAQLCDNPYVLQNNTDGSSL